MEKERPTLEIEKDYRMTLTETLSRQSQYLKINPHSDLFYAVDYIPDQYRFPTHEENVQMLRCAESVSWQSENVNNLL